MSIGEHKGRGSFATNLGFVLAAVGSAVGLGNIWKFPYITGEYGGGAFVLVYLGCIALVGLPLMYAELIIGQRGGKDVLGAMRDLTRRAGMAGKILSYLTGALAVASGFLILSFYSVVAGWAVHYFVVSAGLMPGESLGDDGAFGALIQNKQLSALWHSVFMLLTVGVVCFGIHGGIERLCKVLMPTLVLILLGLLGYVGYTGGLRESLTFLFNPDFSKLTGDAVLEAMGHAFFTLSLGMGAMVTYGSYLKEEKRVIRDGVAVAVLDTAIALIAGAVIFAVVLGAGKEPEAGPGLLFITLPTLFVNMPGGAFVATIFFLLVVFAAWSSAVSLLEVVVAYLVDEHRWNRWLATWLVGIAIWALGLTCACSWILFVPAEGGISVTDLSEMAEKGLYHRSVFDLLDDLTTLYLLPIGGMCIAVAAGWFLTKEDRLSGFASLGAVGKPLGLLWTWLIRYLTPLLVLDFLMWKVYPDGEFLIRGIVAGIKLFSAN